MKKLLLSAFVLTILFACGPSDQEIQSFNDTKKRLEDQVSKIEECIVYLAKCEEYDDPNVCAEQDALVDLEMGVYDTYVLALKSYSHEGAIEGSKKVIEDAEAKRKELVLLWEENKP